MSSRTYRSTCVPARFSDSADCWAPAAARRRRRSPGRRPWTPERSRCPVRTCAGVRSPGRSAPEWGLLPEDRKAEGIIGTLSVRDNIVLAALPRVTRAGIVSQARLERIVDMFMKRLRIEATSPYQPVAELSGGTQQKVLLARWLATNPRVLMLDEPTRGIDIGSKADVLELIDDLARRARGDADLRISTSSSGHATGSSCSATAPWSAS